MCSFKVIAVPDNIEEFLRVAKNKLGLHAAGAIYTKNGGLIDEVDLIRYWVKYSVNLVPEAFFFPSPGARESPNGWVMKDFANDFGDQFHQLQQGISWPVYWY